MSKNYDNWDRLVTAVLRRELDKYIALCSSSDDPTNSSDDLSSVSQSGDFRQKSLVLLREIQFDDEYRNSIPIANYRAAAPTSLDHKSSSSSSSVHKSASSSSSSVNHKSSSLQQYSKKYDPVTVNGHLIPDPLIKKAEKLAGTIHPGHYWYDFRAGFWGAIGGPCLGIIPPSIEEFNFPMPKHCAGGNTGVFVNGRELNQKDLILLGNRGLPMERDRSYLMEISGRVIDEDTHEELDSLGKLAPTVEKLKHGFGMRTTFD